MRRREFLKQGSFAAAAVGFPTIVPASVFGASAPSNRITVGCIGTGRQGYGQNLQGAKIANVPGLLDLADVQVVAVCDVDSWRLEKARTLVNSRYGNQSVKAYGDFQEVLARADIDAVMISTPDHWHVPMAILAAKAKKHVSCEKPLSLSVHQGRHLVDAVAKAGVVNRTDSEFRSVRVQNRAVELVRNGRIGKLQHVEVAFPSDPPPVAAQPDMPVPKELNYEMWLGPSQPVPYTEKRVHTPFDLKTRPNWMRISSYAQGMIANWGAHYFDMVQWANDSEKSGPIAVSGKGEFPKGLWNSMINFEISYEYANGVTMRCRQTPTSTPFIKYIGSAGWILVDTYPGVTTASDPAILADTGKGAFDFSKTLSDKGDWIASIKANQQTFEPLETGHRNMTLSQIGLIACQLEEKLRWNPQSELFEGNNAANALLAEPIARAPWAAQIA